MTFSEIYLREAVNHLLDQRRNHIITFFRQLNVKIDEHIGISPLTKNLVNPKNTSFTILQSSSIL